MSIIKLNVGGFKFCTTAATLTKYPRTYFTCILSGNIPTTQDEEGAYFIDRDGQFFAPILTYLRTNEISFPNSMSKEDLIREVKFYAIQPLVDELTYEPPSAVGNINLLECPKEIERYVFDYWARHQNTILNILERLNTEGYLTITLQIIPGHRQDIERPPQLLENGKLGLYMNFTILHIKKYARVQSLLASCLSKRGLSGYFKPDGELISLIVWWNPPEVNRIADIVYF